MPSNRSVREGSAPDADAHTEQALRASAPAQYKAGTMNHDYVGTEHILFGLTSTHSAVIGLGLGSWTPRSTAATWADASSASVHLKVAVDHPGMLTRHSGDRCRVRANGLLRFNVTYAETRDEGS